MQPFNFYMYRFLMIFMLLLTFSFCCSIANISTVGKKIEIILSWIKLCSHGPAGMLFFKLDQQHKVYSNWLMQAFSFSFNHSRFVQLFEGFFACLFCSSIAQPWIISPTNKKLFVSLYQIYAVLLKCEDRDNTVISLRNRNRNGIWKRLFFALLPLVQKRQMSVGNTSGHLYAFWITRVSLVQISVNHPTHPFCPTFLTCDWALIGCQIIPQEAPSANSSRQGGVSQRNGLSRLQWWNRTSPSAHCVEECMAHECLEGR